MRRLFCGLSILACSLAGCSDAAKAKADAEKQLAQAAAENVELRKEISLLRTQIADLDDVRSLPAEHPVRKETQRLKGAWKLISLIHDGDKISLAASPNILVFSGARIVEASSPDVNEYWLDPAKEPKEIDWIGVAGRHIGVKITGVYSLDGDTLKICHSHYSKKGRPTDFECTRGSERRLLILKRL